MKGLPRRVAGVLLLGAGLTACAPSGTPLRATRTVRAAGPLRVLAANPRYFTADGHRAVYLTGSHTWFNFQDGDSLDPPRPFDYAGYLDFLVAHNHNFFRLWVWEQGSGVTWRRGAYPVAPLPYRRTGPGVALDGKPKYDLASVDTAYFGRLRRRVGAAEKRGIYVSVMLFDGFSVEQKTGVGNPWAGHPFNVANNVNGINGDPLGRGDGRETQTLDLPAITRLQEAYVRRVVDAVGDRDNVLYEISNESDTASRAWQYAMVAYLRRYESERHLAPHPIGMTAAYPGGSNAPLDDGPADWISPVGDVDHPPPADGRKVILWDTDHLCGTCASAGWAWKAFLQGMNPIFMDPYDQRDVPGYDPRDPKWEQARRDLGATLTYTTRLSLASATPQGSRSSSGYCLADTAPGHAAYLVYVSGGPVRVVLARTEGPLAVEWYSPESGRVVAGDQVAGGGVRTLTPPFRGDAVLFLHVRGQG